MNVLRAVILVVLVIKIKWGPYVNVHFLRKCWDKCKFLKAFSKAVQRWQRIQSQNRNAVGRGKTKKRHRLQKHLGTSWA
jgi:hypothetical protein